LGKNDPLKFPLSFVKLNIMDKIPESIKYRTDIFKYAGFALMSPSASILFMCITESKYLASVFSVYGFIFSLIPALLGYNLITFGVKMLDSYHYKDEN
jgi:hypothetical protein